MAQQTGVGAVLFLGHLSATVAYTLEMIATSGRLLGGVPMLHLVIRHLLADTLDSGFIGARLTLVLESGAYQDFIVVRAAAGVSGVPPKVRAISAPYAPEP